MSESLNNTARTWLDRFGKYIAYVIGVLTWILSVITWLVWMLGDRSEPAPPTPTPPPFFVTLDVLPQDVPVFGGQVVDYQLMKGQVVDHIVRPRQDSVLVRLSNNGRISRLRMIQFTGQSHITIDGKLIRTRDELAKYLENHKAIATLYGDLYGPIYSADFTTSE